MQVHRLIAQQLRRFEHLDIQPQKGLNVFQGVNAAGKTSILEAVYTASRAVSFRARKLEEMTRSGQLQGFVKQHSQSSAHALPVEWKVGWEKGETRINRENETCTRKDLTLCNPVALIDRQIYRVFDEGPVYRRSYLDWGLFYVEPDFLGLWRRYERCLRQRNQALRSGASDRELKAWQHDLIPCAEALLQLRKDHVSHLQQQAALWLRDLLGSDQFQFHLLPGWDVSIGLAEALNKGLAGDRKMGYTHSGPHRAELRLVFEEGDVKTFASRGQQKLLAVAMVLAQASWVAEKTLSAPVVLLDDLESELAQEWQQRLTAALLRYPGQVFATSLHWQSGLLPQSSAPHTLFHVEQKGSHHSVCQRLY